MRTVRSVFLFILMLALCSVGIAFCPVYGAETISPGMKLPEFTINLPDSEETRQYLGLKDLNSFSVKQISAKLVLLEIFSLYCPHCHRQAPKANKLYKIIRDNQDLDNDIKVIGIGAGNSLREINVYRTKFRVAFPLAPDRNFEIHKSLGGPRTPFTIIASCGGEVLLTHQGVVEDLDEFLRQIRKCHEKQ
ncbi:MAG: TlpA family protein disulfide reductase [Deltaproteobacteria bacterium]|nr:MAG: TlpA family protein disulfide reductase [Deltaproteobacteria bacterium]